MLFALAIGLLNACGGGNSKSNNGGTATVTECTGDAPELVAKAPQPFSYSTLEDTVSAATADQCGLQTSELITLSGTVTYDYVPISSEGLDYDSISANPVRGATVEIRYESGRLYGRTRTNETGQYSINVPQNQTLRVWALAELRQEADASYEIKITDNTSDNALYVLSGDAICSGTENSTRDLHASSGWGGVSYTSERSAAPFAILDTLYMAVSLLTSTDPNIQIHPFEMRWSTQNRAVSGNRANGEIGTSSYLPSENVSYILGDEDNDTDEYDRSVLLHEFTHFLENRQSRSDSIGGSHSLVSSNDMRLAHSEGLANAFSSIFSESELYRDSGGPQQGQLGASFSLEDNPFTVSGWFNENSIGKIVYDIWDDDSEAGDNLALGFTPIYQTLTDTDYVFSEALMSVFLFADILSAQLNSTDENSLELLLSAEDINGRGAFGEGEDNAGSTSISLPVYTEMESGDTETLCSNENGGSFNGVGVRRFVKLDIAEEACYQFNAEKTSGPSGLDTDPDILLHYGGNQITAFESGTIDLERGSQRLRAGTYILEFFDFNNIESDTRGGNSCFNLSISQSEN